MPNDEPLWLPLPEVIEINREAVALTGEPFLVSRLELLDSALASPRNAFLYGEKDVLTLAVNLLLAIARNHPFMQGNKRTAFTAAENFLQINGYMLDAPDSEDLAQLIIDCIEGKLSREKFEQTLRNYIIPNPD